MRSAAFLCLLVFTVGCHDPRGRSDPTITKVVSGPDAGTPAIGDEPPRPVTKGCDDRFDLTAGCATPEWIREEGWGPAFVQLEAESDHVVWARDERGTVLRGWNGHFSGGPRPDGRVYRDLWVHDASTVWLVGTAGLVARWDGRRLETLDLGTADDVVAVHGSAADDVWVATKSRLFHFDGASFEERPVPTGTTIWDLRAFAPDDAWLTDSPEGVLHWDGAGWRASPDRLSWPIGYGNDESTPAPPHGSILLGRPDALWLSDGGDTLLFFDGHAWSVAASRGDPDVSHSFRGTAPWGDGWLYVWDATFVPGHEPWGLTSGLWPSNHKFDATPDVHGLVSTGPDIAAGFGAALATFDGAWHVPGRERAAPLACVTDGRTAWVEGSEFIMDGYEYDRESWYPAGETEPVAIPTARYADESPRAMRIGDTAVVVFENTMSLLRDGLVETRPLPCYDAMLAGPSIEELRVWCGSQGEYRWTGADWAPTRLVAPPSPVQAIVIANDQGWSVTRQGDRYRWNGAAWAPEEGYGPSSSLFGTPDLGAWGLDDGRVWRWNGRGWSALPGLEDVSSFAVRTADEVWAVTRAGRGVRWTPAGVTAIDLGGARPSSFCATDTAVWALTDAGLFRRDR